MTPIPRHPPPGGPLEKTSGDLPALVERTRGLQPWRRVFHACVGMVLAWLPLALGLPRGALLGALATLLALLLAADLVRLMAPGLNALFFASFPSLASPREAERLASSTWYVLGVLLVYALFPVRVAVPAILVLALADPAASALGRLVGRGGWGRGRWRGAWCSSRSHLRCWGRRWGGARQRRWRWG